MSNKFVFRVLDGIFLGNSNSFQAIHYLDINQITHIVNCAASEIQAPTNFIVLNYFWKDEDEQIIVTMSNLRGILIFVEQAIRIGESVLFCCLDGQNRSLTALIGYFMYRYNWSLLKSLQYINIWNKDLQIRGSYLKQLLDFEQKEMSHLVISNDWFNKPDNQEQVLLHNTYLNSVQKPIQYQTMSKIKNQINKKVTWNACLMQENSRESYCNQTQKKVKSILKNNNVKQLDLYISSLMNCPKASKPQFKSIDEEQFLRKNTQTNRRKQQCTLIPINELRINNQSLIIPSQEMRRFLYIENQSQQYQRKFRSQTNSPQLIDRHRNLSSQNDRTFLDINHEETNIKFTILNRVSPCLNRKTQFKLFRIL